jgi:hypothetical protein
MENKKNFYSSHHFIIPKINNKMEQSKKIHGIRKIKRGKNIIIFSKTLDGNLKLVQYFEYGLIKNVDKNIIVSHSNDLTTVYNSFINKIMDSTKNLEISLKKDILKQFYHSIRCKNNQCNYAFCKPIKELSEHILHCTKSNCDVYYCECSKSLLEHHNACKRDKSYCEVCTHVIRVNYKI